MNNKIITGALILFLVIALLVITKKEPKKDDVLLSPPLQPSIIVAPKTYTLDSSTDLKKELESINPQVLDNDFE